MLASLRELRKYVDLSGLSAENIAKKLTVSGLEVDGVKTLARGTNLVIGKVIYCEKMEGTHLHKTKVDIGSEVLNIVCGAPNVREGIKVIVAKNGAVLPGGKIERSVIHGEESNGMLCSLLELGVDDKYLTEEEKNGIEELGEDAQVGDQNVLGYLGLDDQILDIDLLANRSDCYALFNLAREIGALFSRDVKTPEAKDDSTFKSDFKVGSKTDKCPSFSLKIVEGVEVKESPKWLKDALRSEGIRSINNLVDLGNYIMVLTGQPLHIYDLDKLHGDLIVKDDVSLTYRALDGKDYAIEKGDLVVTSAGEASCIAGILGGENSEVSDATKNIAIEAAYFDGATIRRTSTRLGEKSESSIRFMKGINKDQSEYVLNLTTAILKKVSKVGRIAKILKYNTLDHKAKKIAFSVEYINSRLGTAFSKETIVDTLEKLGFTIEGSGEELVATVPNYRIDIDGKADLSEEVVRYNGLDNIHSILPLMETTVGGYKKDEEKRKLIASYLLGRGLDQIVTYTLINAKDEALFNYLNKDEGYVIANPLTEDHKYVRRNLLSSMLRTVEYNINHQNRNFKLFEISHIDTKKDPRTHLVIALCGKKMVQDQIALKDFSYFDVKGLLEGIFRLFNIEENRVKYSPLKEDGSLHPYRSAEVSLDNKLLAVLGEVDPRMRGEFSLLKEPVAILEVDLDLLFATRSKNDHFSDISRFPSSSRDYAFLIDSSVKYSDLSRAINRASSDIKEVSLFDVYSGDNIPQGKTSLAIRVTFENPQRTLKDDDINAADLKIKTVLADKFKAEIRK
jgi:phenylalanyl-tRNA synthetase beta chain